MEPANQHILEPVDPGPDIGRGKAGNGTDFFGVQTFQVGQHHLAIADIEALDQLQQTCERLLTIGGSLHIVMAGLRFGFFQGLSRAGAFLLLLLWRIT